MTSDGETMGASAAEDTNAAGPEPGGAETEAAAAIQALEAEKAELKDRLMRSLADTENLRRRSEREIADARVYASTNFARDMLTVADNIRRALESVPRQDGAVPEAARSLVEGVELTERDLAATLARHGVKLLEPAGQKFDPNMHQAMFEVPNDEVPNGTVVTVVQSGYAIGDRVLRPALVGVSKASARPVPAAGGAGAEQA